MRYAALYNAATGTWSVIAYDHSPGEDYWTVYLADAGGQGPAQEITAAMNEASDRAWSQS